MSRCSKHGNEHSQECWTLRGLRRFQEHTDVLRVIYDDLRPLGRGIIKFTVVASGCFAGLDVLEQVVTLLM